jgi:hypothetical protein
VERIAGRMGFGDCIRARFPHPAGPERTSPRRPSRSRPAGPPRCRRCSPVTTTRGGDVCRSPGHLRPLRGDGGGDVPPPGKRRAGPVLKGKGVGRSPSLSSRMCSVRSILRNHFSSRSG